MASSQAEARYRWAPQMREYDSLKYVWHPYVMSFHEANHSSPAVHTDERGFRFSAKGGSAVSNFDGAQGERGLIVGGSVAFGVGASSDAKTIPSILNEKSQTTWLNFGGMAISSTQELLLFLFQQRDLGNLKKVVFFSGLNELVLALMGLKPATGYGPIFSLDAYNSRMNRVKLSSKRKLLKAALEPIKGKRTDWADAPIGELLFSKQAHETKSADDINPASAVEHYRKNLSAWKRLCEPMGIEMSFVLQPIVTWIDKEHSQEERELFAELDQRSSNTWRTISERFSPDQLGWYSSELASICAAEGIAFHDSNEEYGNGKHNGEWLFVDRAHMTDRGNEVAAEFIASRL